MYPEEDAENENKENNHQHREEEMKYAETDANYLALSDTDTLSCYRVPSPIYPSLGYYSTGHQRTR